MNDDDIIRQLPLNAGSRGLARNPADLYERQEATTCKGCVHIDRMTVSGSTVEICAIGKGYGRRCKRYDEGKPVRW